MTVTVTADAGWPKVPGTVSTEEEKTVAPWPGTTVTKVWTSEGVKPSEEMCACAFSAAAFSAEDVGLWVIVSLLAPVGGDGWLGGCVANRAEPVIACWDEELRGPIAVQPEWGRSNAPAIDQGVHRGHEFIIGYRTRLLHVGADILRGVEFWLCPELPLLDDDVDREFHGSLLGWMPPFGGSWLWIRVGLRKDERGRGFDRTGLGCR